MGYPEDIAVLEKQWGRRLAAYFDVGDDVICSVWADDALTGWVLYIESPVIQDFNGDKCVAVSLTSWQSLKALGNDTVTPFRVVAKGKNLIAKAFQPHVDLKHAVRAGAEDRINVLIPIGEFKVVGDSAEETYKGK